MGQNLILGTPDGQKWVPGMILLQEIPNWYTTRPKMAQIGYFGSFWAFFKPKFENYGPKPNLWHSRWSKMGFSHDFTTRNT